MSYIKPSFLIFIFLFVVGCSQESSVESQSDIRASQRVPEVKDQALPKGSYRMKPYEVVDPNGFGKPMVAAHVFLPLGWKTQGGIVWQVNNRGCGKNGTRFEWAAYSPDGQTAVEILPEETWAGNNLQVPNQTQCPNVWLRSAKEYLQAYVQNNRSTARVRSYRERPDIVSLYQHFNRRDAMPMGEIRTWVESGEVILDYEYQGKQMEEVLILAVVFSLNRMQGVMPGEIREFLTMATMPGFSMRAPKGKLDLKLAETIRKSGRPTQKWSQLMAQHNAKMASINRKGAMARHKIRMDTQREIFEMQQDSYKKNQAVRDKGNEKFNQMIRGVETYSNPGSNEQVELPYTHKNAWKLEDDTYILTDDEFFQPYKDLGVDGTKLQRTE